MIKTYATHFCGVGGACYGLEQAGLECRFAIDYLEPAVEYREINLSHRAHLGDITEYEHKPQDAADLLWTSPPCQTFSTSAREQAGQRARQGIKDKRDNLFLASLEYCAQFKPSFFVLENVMGLLTHNADGMGHGTMRNMIGAFEDIGYIVEFNVLCSADFGCCQKRERVFIVGCLPEIADGGLIPDDGSIGGLPTRTPPAFETIMQPHLEKLAWGAPTYKTAVSKVQRTGVEISVVMPGDILPTVTCGWGGGATRKKVAIADTTASGTPFLRHPSVREGARAQGFPEDWKFPEAADKAWTLIGNAVASPVAEAIGRHLVALSKGEKPPSKGELPLKRVAEYVRSYRNSSLPEIKFG